MKKKPQKSFFYQQGIAKRVKKICRFQGYEFRLVVMTIVVLYLFFIHSKGCNKLIVAIVVSLTNLKVEGCEIAIRHVAFSFVY